MSLQIFFNIWTYSLKLLWEWKFSNSDCIFIEEHERIASFLFLGSFSPQNNVHLEYVHLLLFVLLRQWPWIFQNSSLLTMRQDLLAWVFVLTLAFNFVKVSLVNVSPVPSHASLICEVTKKCHFAIHKVEFVLILSIWSSKNTMWLDYMTSDNPIQHLESTTDNSQENRQIPKLLQSQDWFFLTKQDCSLAI